jgi:hypothetical protein
MNYIRDDDLLKKGQVTYSFPSLTNREVLTLWVAMDPQWSCVMLSILVNDNPFAEYRIVFSHFRLTSKNGLDDQFSFVIHKDAFRGKYEKQFDGYFEEAILHSRPVVAFSGRDKGVILVVPSPEFNFPAVITDPKKKPSAKTVALAKKELNYFRSLGPFAKRVTELRTDGLIDRWIRMWSLVACEVLESKTDVWVYTHGHGVAWLHLRIEKELRYQ